VINIVWDMETNDPDDFLTLLLLAGHREVNLKAVTVLPGSPAQIGLVRHALREWFRLEIPVGAHNLKGAKAAVSPWHYVAYGDIPPSLEARPAAEVLLEQCDSETTLITGAPLTNLRNAIHRGDTISRPFVVGRLVAQGGFAGEGVVPPELQLEKFKGLAAVPTFNLMGDTKGAALALSHGGIGSRYFVSKNVCHRVIYDTAMHEQLQPLTAQSAALRRIWQGMDVYLKHKPGKMLHDPLAACCAIDESIGTWAEVELYRERNTWGSRLAPGSNTRIIIDYDHAKFMRVFTACR